MHFVKTCTCCFLLDSLLVNKLCDLHCWFSPSSLKDCCFTIEPRCCNMCRMWFDLSCPSLKKMLCTWQHVLLQNLYRSAVTAPLNVRPHTITDMGFFWLCSDSKQGGPSPLLPLRCNVHDFQKDSQILTHQISGQFSVFADNGFGWLSSGENYPVRQSHCWELALPWGDILVLFNFDHYEHQWAIVHCVLTVKFDRLIEIVIIGVLSENHVTNLTPNLYISDHYTHCQIYSYGFLKTNLVFSFIGILPIYFLWRTP